MEVITMGDSDVDSLDVLRQSACQVGRRRTTQGASEILDIVLRQLDLRGVIGENASPELRGSWTFDNQLKMFATICHFSSEIFQSLDPAFNGWSRFAVARSEFPPMDCLDSRLGALLYLWIRETPRDKLRLL